MSRSFFTLVLWFFFLILPEALLVSAHNDSLPPSALDLVPLYGRGTSNNNTSSASSSQSTSQSTSNSASSPTSKSSTPTTTPSKSPAAKTPSVSATPISAFKPLTGELKTVYTRALDFIAEAIDQTVDGISDIPTLLSTQKADGTWPDVDYKTGCDAQRSNWPAQIHWSHINRLSAAYHGTVESGSKYVNSTKVRAAMDKGMNWWFARDFKVPECIDQGGKAGPCPCGTPGLWNSNFFSNVIGTPRLVGRTCLLLRNAVPSLTADQIGNCTTFTARAFGRFGTGQSYLAGANILDIASIGVFSALIQADTKIMTQAYQFVHTEVAVHNDVKVDGIKGDGSFQQHLGLIYNGNYGKDYTNDVLMLEIQAAGTKWTAPSSSRNAFIQYVDGFTWTIFRNVARSVLRWDISVIGRFLAFPIADSSEAGASIHINITQMNLLASLWNESKLKNSVKRLKTASGSNANVGNLVGNRMFYENDYMVQRAGGVVTTLRMYSSRTINTECVNLANPLGFHLADGTIYTYKTGSEYEDITASWDWNLIPGTTVDYGSTPLTCDSIKKTGVESFVGGASDGKVGVAAMSYTNPTTKAFGWKKAYFFFEDGTQRVVVNSINTSPENAAKFPVMTVLDQKRRKGDIRVDGKLVSPGSKNISFSNAGSLWHDNMGYVFDSKASLSLYASKRKGNWSALGTSTQPPTTVELFGAWINHNNPTAFNQPVGYTIYPGASFSKFNSVQKSSSIRSLDTPSAPVTPPSVISPLTTSGVLDTAHNTAMVVFWSPTGGSIAIPFDGAGKPPVTVSVNQAVTMIIRKGEGITVADPSQKLKNVVVKMTWANWGSKSARRDHTEHIARSHMSHAPRDHQQHHGAGKRRVDSPSLDLREIESAEVEVEKRARDDGHVDARAVKMTTRTITVNFPTATPGASVKVSIRG